MPHTVAIIGLGYVGLPLARALSKKRAYRVLGVDIDAKKIRSFRNEYRRSLIDFTTDFQKLTDMEIIVVCVPTPILKNNLPDYRPLKNVSTSIARHIDEKKRPLVIIESTINPGTCEEVIIPVFKKSGREVNEHFLLAHCPERIDPGNKKWVLANIPRVVGANNSAALKKALRFYRSFIAARVKAMKSLKSAEATKIVENAFRDINIAYVNELAKSFDALGIDVTDVLEGAATKPFAFLPHHPGCGVGGHCIPVDPYYLIERAKKDGFSHDFLKMARRVNHGMPAYTVSLLEEQMKKLKLSKRRVTIGLLGLAYKPHIDDLRESPAVHIFHILKKKKFNVIAFDPYIKTGFSAARTLDSFLKKSNVLILATAHKEFTSLKPALLKKYNILAVIDGRNALSKDKIIGAGIVYKGIGR